MIHLHPTIPEIINDVKNVQRTNLSRAINHFPNPVMASEIGRPNFDGTSYDPWTWSNEVENQAIIDYLEAAFRTMFDLEPRFEGIFYWQLWAKPDSELNPVEWDFRGKPHEEMLRYWFSN